MNHTPPKPKNIPKLTHYSLARSLNDYITLNVPPVALSIVPLQKMSLSVRQSYDYF